MRRAEQHLHPGDRHPLERLRVVPPEQRDRDVRTGRLRALATRSSRPWSAPCQLSGAKGAGGGIGQRPALRHDHAARIAHQDGRAPVERVHQAPGVEELLGPLQVAYPRERERGADGLAVAQEILPGEDAEVAEGAPREVLPGAAGEAGARLSRSPSARGTLGRGRGPASSRPAAWPVPSGTAARGGAGPAGRRPRGSDPWPRRRRTSRRA